VTAPNPTWVVEDKHRLLMSVAENLAGNAHISLEGSLGVFNLAALPGASDVETSALKRNTIWPRQDFLVFPLEPPVAEAVFKRLGYRVPNGVIHVQIEKNGVLEFGAYDNFDRNSMYWGPALTGSFVESLVSQGILSAGLHHHK
jgi:hypothetical protein